MAQPASEITTVEQLVRSKLSEALGGRRGVLESAAPIVAFTISWLTSHELKLSLLIAIGIAVVLLVIRLAQRGNVQFVLNAAVGIAIAATIAARSGEARDVFLPGIIYNAAYAAVTIVSIAVRWPVVGFMFGAVTGEATQWRADRGLLRLCSRLSWLLVLPCIVRVVVQYPLWVADQVALLGVSKIALGWPLQIAALGAMGWLLSRNSTPLQR
jgi:hypothetical protein